MRQQVITNEQADYQAHEAKAQHVDLRREFEALPEPVNLFDPAALQPGGIADDRADTYEKEPKNKHRKHRQKYST